MTGGAGFIGSALVRHLIRETQAGEVVAGMICDLLDQLTEPFRGRKSRRELITFVADRPGHDARYALDARKLREELGWHPQAAFESALKDTVAWYLSNEA